MRTKVNCMECINFKIIPDKKKAKKARCVKNHLPKVYALSKENKDFGRAKKCKDFELVA